MQCLAVAVAATLSLLRLHLTVVAPHIAECEEEKWPNTLLLLMCSVIHEPRWDAPLSVEDLGMTQADFDAKYIGSGERFVRDETLAATFGTSALFRTTLGYEGEKLLNVSFSYPSQPNVVVLMLESWRAREVGALKYNYAQDTTSSSAPSPPPPPDDGWVSPTQNFDKLAAKGLLFSNAWSNKMTTQSLEAVMFGMLNLPGSLQMTVAGRNHHYRGLHTLMREKGYETYVSNAGDMGDMSFDGWHTFLRNLGYAEDHLWGETFHTRLAKKNKVHIGDSTLFWGLHDDVTFKTLAIKIKEMNENRKAGGGQKPFLIQHYTISTHGPWEDRPGYYHPPNYSKQSKSVDHRHYQEMLHFADQQLGSFFDEMDASGASKNTVFLLMADHSRWPYGPPNGATRIDSYSHEGPIAALLLADGQLGRYEGTMTNATFGPADVVSTIADLLGVPEGGFQQHGSGRSVLRKEERPKRVYTRALRCAVQEGVHLMICKCDVETSCELFNIEKDWKMQHNIRHSGEVDEATLAEREKDVRMLAKYEASKTIQDKNVPHDF